MNDEKFFSIILNLMTRNFNINMRYYDKKYLMRRITSRMAELEIKSFQEYYKYLVKNKNELEYLINYIAINYTEFFRDKEVFKYIYEKIFPSIFKKKTIFMLSAGCSTGQEAYSLSMLVNEYLKKDLDKYMIKIYAGDIDKDALNYATRGIYREEEIRNVEEYFLKKYFIKNNGFYKVTENVKRIVEFIYMDLTVDQKFREYFDLILCRNVIIYIDQKYKRKIFENLYNMLRENGFLVIGKSESLPINFRDKFETISLENKIYMKK